MWWLPDRSQAAADFARNYLWTHTAEAVTYAGHRVETTQVAPTILKLLGLSPRSLQAVRLERTQVLPGL